MNRKIEIAELGSDCMGVTLDGVPVVHLHRWEDDPGRRELYIELKSLLGMFAAMYAETRGGGSV